LLETPQRIYWDRKYYTSFEEQVDALHGSSTLYVGNLSFYTTELQIHETFARVGPIKRIIMGLNRDSRTPCGFCFVEYFTHEHARECLKFINGTMCDDRIIRCELDGGFKQGRQFGRGVSGGQIRDERRTDIDLGRGGVVQKSFLGKGKRNERHEQRDRNDYPAPAPAGDRDRDRRVDAFGRDPPRRSHLNDTLPTSRSQSNPFQQNKFSSPANGNGGSDSPSDPVTGSRHRDQMDDDEEERPRKNPRFREETEGNENEHEED
jgi:nuclear cap-binding protein subunit 2